MGKKASVAPIYGDEDDSQPDDLITGGNYNDLVYAYMGDDDVDGGNGNDQIEGGYGDDHLEGGNGNDTLYGDNHAEYEYEGDASLLEDDDYLNGGNGKDVLYGQAGDDELHGENGKDSLYGDDGDDILYGGTGKDYLDGGEGLDTVSYEEASGGVIVNLATGVAKGNSEGKDTLVDIENVIGSDFNDTLTGNDANNILSGEGGDDTLNGGLGNDILIGGEDADDDDDDDDSVVAVATTDNDTLNGGDGDDILIGGAGADVLTGGIGADTFVFDSLDAVDTVTDFVSGTDKLGFDDDAFGSLDDLAFGAGNFVAGTTALDADDFLLYDSTTGTLYYDADGNGAGTSVTVAQFGVGTTVAYTDVVVDS